MEFWGIEVKGGKSVTVKPEYDKIVHVSQAALGEVKDVKGAISVPLRLNIGDKKYVIGNLSAEDRPQLMLDLVFEKQFELSHDWKDGSVYFVGYIANDPCGDDEVFSDEKYSSGEEEELERIIHAKLEAKTKRDEAGERGKSDDDFTDISLENGSESSSMDESDFSDEDDSSDGTLDLPETKRPSKSVVEIPVPAKKAKLPTPEKRGGNKKGQAGKAQPAGNKSNGQMPKSGKQSNKSSSGSGKKAKRGGK